MMRNSTIPLVLVASMALAAAGREAHANTWVDSLWQQNSSTCPVTGTATAVATALVGYEANFNPVFPRTGDVAYVHAYAANVSPCLNDGMSIELYLPAGATLAVSAATPVYCRRGKLDGTVDESIPTASNSNCLQQPGAGPNGGPLFAWSAMPPGWWMEVKVPVRYDRELPGSLPANQTKVTAAVGSAYGVLWAAQPVAVQYRALLQNQATSSVTATTASLSFDLFSYFGVGQLAVDFGPTAAFGSTTLPVNVPGTAASFPITTSLSGLTPNTMYFWRGRFVTNAGLQFTTATQSFVTSAAAPVTLSVALGGGGYGRVVSNPSGIDCRTGSAGSCSATFAWGARVSLDAAPASPGYTFTGWSGACTGLGTCTVTLSAAASVTANFEFFRPIPLPLPEPPPRRG